MEKDLTSSEPALTTLLCHRSPEMTTTHPLLPWVRLRSISSSEKIFPHGWKELEQQENLHLSQQRLLNHWLVAPQETPSCVYLERHVPSEARPPAGREWTGGCRRYTPWQVQPHLRHGWQRKRGCQKVLQLSKHFCSLLCSIGVCYDHSSRKGAFSFRTNPAWDCS